VPYSPLADDHSVTQSPLCWLGLKGLHQNVIDYKSFPLLGPSAPPFCRLPFFLGDLASENCQAACGKDTDCERVLVASLLKCRNFHSSGLAVRRQRSSLRSTRRKINVFFPLRVLISFSGPSLPRRRGVHADRSERARLALWRLVPFICC